MSASLETLPEGLCELPIDSIVRDPALQLRVAMDEEWVKKLAYALKHPTPGKPMPAVSVVRDRDSGELLLVDGWHRHSAHLAFGAEAIQAFVLVGSYREALLAAAGANGRHGKGRSKDDVRRVVMVFLKDDEWCKLSHRGVAALADCSHTAVGNWRKHWGVKKGDMLTAARVEEVDGEPGPEWQNILREHPHWSNDVNRVRVAQDLKELDKAGGSRLYAKPMKQAVELRLMEMGSCSEWPWPEDSTPQASVRICSMGTRADLEKLLGWTGCPDRLEYFKVWQVVLKLPKTAETYTLDTWLREHAGRPELVAAIQKRLDKRRAAVEAEQGKKSWVQAGRAERVSGEPEKFAEALALMDADGITTIIQRMHTVLPPRAGELLKARAVEVMADKIEPCPSPICSGWHVGGSCVVCLAWPDRILERIEIAKKYSPALLQTPGFEVQVGDVRLNHAAVELLRVLQASREVAPNRFADWVSNQPSGGLSRAIKEYFDDAETAGGGS